MSNSETPELYQALYRQDLASFIGRSVEITHPNAQLIPNWHLGLMAEYLNACAQGELSRLIINMPPRYMKSHAVSVAWPAWLLGHQPSRQIIAASYSSAISLKHSIDARALVQSNWYPALKKAIINAAEKHQPEIILIEDKASGQSLIQELKSSTHLPIIAIQPKGDKLQRLLRVLGLFEAGKVQLLQGALWLAEVEREWLGFPEMPHDDIVDATTQFLNWIQMREMQENGWKIRVL